MRAPQVAQGKPGAHLRGLRWRVTRCAKPRGWWAENPWGSVRVWCATKAEAQRNAAAGTRALKCNRDKRRGA